MYHGTAILADGSQIETDGTIDELCEWADQLAAENGDIRINIGRVGAA